MSTYNVRPVYGSGPDGEGSVVGESATLDGARRIGESMEGVRSYRIYRDGHMVEEIERMPEYDLEWSDQLSKWVPVHKAGSKEDPFGHGSDEERLFQELDCDLGDANTAEAFYERLRRSKECD